MIKLQTVALAPRVYSTLKTNSLNCQNAKKANTGTDAFIKQQDNVSFGGFRKNRNNKIKTEDNLASSLKNVSIKGMPFLLGLATSAAMVKMGKGAKELLCNEDGYKVSENGVKSDLVNIDEKQGVIEFEGTGIKIDTDKCDIVDWENGIFKNYDGSIDIDLGNNKFIDTEAGILVDPSENISAVLDGEHFENIAIPTFGSGYPTCPWDDRWATIDRHMDTEEKESVFDKAGDFIRSIFGDNSEIDTEDMRDIFGNKIVEATDATGDTYLTYIPQKLEASPVFDRFKQLLGDDETAVEFANNMHLKSYIEDKYPSFGTRVMAYEGGRNSWGGQMPDIEETYDSDMADEVLGKIAEHGGYFPEPGSLEAINFAKYQNLMIKEGVWEKPLISYDTLLDLDNDDKSDIDLDDDGVPDMDLDGDGIIDMSSEHHLAYIWEAFKDFLGDIFGD